MKRIVAAGVLFLTLYLILTTPLALWPLSDISLGLVAYTLYSLLAVGLAADVTELILALSWSVQIIPRAQGVVPRHKAAVLMTVCDDWTSGYLEGLQPLAEAGYDVFVLDDSYQPAMLPAVLKDCIVHISRNTHAGAKAGNLNHWLWCYGTPYTYAIVLDADSMMSTVAVDHLVLAAEHPENAQIAIFQSKVESTLRHGSLFARVLAAGARPRVRVLEHVHGPLGLLLSFGHNQLLRLDPVRALGGFDETLTNEDTVLSLDLAATGWHVALLDVWSHNAEPDTVTAYTRRTIRWARQTVELFGRSWGPVPLRLKLLLCRHLLTYAIPLVGTILLIISLWTGPSQPSDAWTFLVAALTFQQDHTLYGLTLWPMFCVFGLVLALRIILAHLEGVPWRTQLLVTLLGSAPYAVLLLPLAIAMGTSAMGRRVRFVPTNSRHARQRDRSLLARLGRAISTGLLLGLLMAGAVHRPGSVLVGFNFLWLVFLLLSPVGSALHVMLVT